MFLRRKFKKDKDAYKAELNRQQMFRNDVLWWAEKFAKHYAKQGSVDLRAMPTQMPLGRLIVVIDRYLSHGIDGIAASEVQDLIAATEHVKQQVISMRESIDSADSVPVTE